MNGRIIISSCFLLLLLSIKGLGQQAKHEGTRQIHLDFHTSEHLLNIGEKFDKKQFQQALIEGNVNSINVFAKGHHGWCYYPSEAGAMHPHLKFDLLKEEIEACHEIGVRVQAYITVGWSVKDAREHPEWRYLNKEGKTFSHNGRILDEFDTSRGLPDTWWELLSPEGGYLELILKQTEEICKNYDIDGVWYDIIPIEYINYNANSIADMQANGIDVNNQQAANEYHVQKMRKFFEKTTDVVKKYRPQASLFYNWTTTMNYKNAINYDLFKYNTKQDLEDLPTTWDGYDIFPMRSKFFANTGDELVAMSGKFHTAWGEFGGFKHKNALLYEAASMLAFGARANFGDQLHPSGEMELETYRNIGYAFDYVEKIEEYSLGGKDIANLGIWLSLEKEHDEGTVKMLLENQVDFLVLNNLDNWDGIETIVINGGVQLDHKNTQRIQEFLDHGGNLLVMGTGALNKNQDKFLFNLGAQYVGPAKYDIDFTTVTDEIADNLPKSPFLNYEAAIKVKATNGSEVLAYIREPYFSRTLKHYTSHRNTPYQLENAKHPAVIKHGNTIFIAHSLGKQYFETGAHVHRDLFYNALRLIHNKSLVEVELPSNGRINLIEQADKKRYVLHLLYATPTKRGIAEVIEDLVPLYETPIKLHTAKTIKRIYSIPGHETIPFVKKHDEVQIILPKFTCHKAIVFEY
ncbi:hypothetical protein EYV94_21030 [Puteibacter caeruleilacunae]|nr:hypothetical protein EYV94_21030 [Puteibacter caeruleilacunae]